MIFMKIKQIITKQYKNNTKEEKPPRNLREPPRTSESTSEKPPRTSENLRETLRDINKSKKTLFCNNHVQNYKISKKVMKSIENRTKL